MNIAKEVSFDKEGRIDRFPLFHKLFLSLVIILLAGLSFGLGRLSVAGEREPVRIEYDALISNQAPITDLQTSQTASVIQAISGQGVVTSKNGSKYHYSHCSGAKQIKEENKIFFAGAKEAEIAGYTLAANCSPK